MSVAPFRADHVGSLLRPASLIEARNKHALGTIDEAALRAAEDKAIADVVRLQESAGLKAITDGEFRRAHWLVDFLTGFEGIAATKSDYTITFKGKGGETATTSSMMVVNAPVRHRKPIMVDHFAYLKSVAKQTAKLCIPSPTYMHMRGGRKVVDQKAYPDMAGFWDDITSAYRAEIDALLAAGCTYLQLDDVSFANLCDENICNQIAQDGENPRKLPELYANIINRIIADRPKTLDITIHTCRGNHASMWMAEGGYEPVADALFSITDVNGFFLEFDTERAGDFAPLRFVPKGKRVVLGLISSKEPELETKDMLKRRIDEAARYMPLDQICISPQCGFASTAQGNKITEDIEKRKLELAVDVARDVWGDA
jgi:5-methyltetrahydropteroyltriglutamate--homocysteine methyltransferase